MWKPFASVFTIICALFIVVFLQMEERRQGYVLLKIRKEQKQLFEEKRDIELKLARIQRPQLVQHLAESRLTLKKVRPNQIILLSGDLNQSETRQIR